MAWYGADPGGIRAFGLARLEEDGSFSTHCCSSVEQALDWIDRPAAIGIDCPLWWSTEVGGGRLVDGWIRKTHAIRSGTVQSVNSLKGAVVVQGVLLAMRLRVQEPSLPITETHPKALRKALGLERWEDFMLRFEIRGSDPGNEHERDALLGAVVAREGPKCGWTDLSLTRGQSELDPKTHWFGPVHYWWPTQHSSGLPARPEA